MKMENCFHFQRILTEEALDRSGRISKLHSSAILDTQTAERLSIKLLDEEMVERARRLEPSVPQYCV